MAPSRERRVLKVHDLIGPESPPLAVVYWKQQPAGPQDEPMHGHEFTELVIALEGKGQHVIEQRPYPLAIGDVFVIPPGIEHGYTGIRDAYLANILFDMSAFRADFAAIENLPGFHAMFVLEPKVRQTAAPDRRLHLDADSLDVVGGLVQRMSDERRRRPPGYRLMLATLFQELIVYLSRWYELPDKPQTHLLVCVGRVLSYIEAHYAEPITLETLGRVACVSKPTLNRYFHEVLDTSPFDHLLRFRIQKAADRLRSTDAKIIDVALSTGFNDSNYFGFQFSRRMGCSPREFRKTQQAAHRCQS